MLFRTPEKEDGSVSSGLIVLLSPKRSHFSCAGSLPQACAVHVRVNRVCHCGSPGTRQSPGLKRGSCLVLYGPVPSSSQLCFSFMRVYILQLLPTFLNLLGRTKKSVLHVTLKPLTCFLQLGAGEALLLLCVLCVVCCAGRNSVLLLLLSG